ncbi:hypothetical protein D3C86_2085880 [compost metagenome]
MFDNHTPVGKEHMIGDFFGKPHFMCYEDARHALLREVSNNGQNFTDHFRVKRCSYLIEQYDARLHG